MTVTRATTHLPTKWPGFPGLIAQGNVSVGHGRLRAKLLVFRNPTAMRRFWRKRMGNDLGLGCLGAVNALRMSVYDVQKGKPDVLKRIEMDARYFCVIGLCAGYLNMRIISHECVHAGFSFARRRNRAPWDGPAMAFDEEAVAYPAGEMARSVVYFLRRRKLLP